MKNNHPLVCRFGTLNDMIMLTPLLKRLYERSGVPVDIISMGEWNNVLFENMLFVNDVYVLTPCKAPYIFNKAQKKLVQHLKKNNHQHVWICDDNKHITNLLSKGGVNTNNAISTSSTPKLNNEGAITYWLRFADQTPNDCEYATLAPPQLEDTTLFVSDYEKDVCRNWLGTRGVSFNKPMICIQPDYKAKNANNQSSLISGSDWAKLINQIMSDIPEAQILLCGSTDEKTQTLKIKSLCDFQDTIFSIADDLPLRRLITILSLAHSCISIDIGPTHIAAAVNCPVTVLTKNSYNHLNLPASKNSHVKIVTSNDLAKDNIIYNRWAESIS